MSADRLSEEVLAALGFKSTWPAGNPTEPWWRHPSIEHTFWDGRPTFAEILDVISKNAAFKARREIQKDFARLLGIRS